MSIEPPGPPPQTEGATQRRRAAACRWPSGSVVGLGVVPHARVALPPRARVGRAPLSAGGSRDAAPRPSTSPTQAHHGQTRVTGEPYITHPLASAQILADIGIDPVAVTAAILHDVPEDTDFTLDDIEEQFGTEVAQLVDGVTKLSKFSTHTHEEQQAENIRKMFLAMADDIRVVLIKLADRLHNMRTLYALPSDKQQPHRPPDARDLRPAGRAPRASGASSGSSRTWRSRPSSRSAYRELARMLDTRRKGREAFIHRAIDDASAGAGAGGHRGRAVRPAEAPLQHLEEDAAQERRDRRDLRRLRHPDPRGRGQGLLRRPGRRPLAVAARSPASSTTTSPSPSRTSTRASTPP